MGSNPTPATKFKACDRCIGNMARQSAPPARDLGWIDIVGVRDPKCGVLEIQDLFRLTSGVSNGSHDPEEKAKIVESEYRLGCDNPHGTPKFNDVCNSGQVSLGGSNKTIKVSM